MKILLFFLESYTGCPQSGENFNFSSCPEFPRFCFKSILWTDEEQGETHYHDGSWLLLNTTFLSFLSTLNGCCDASEINILVNILKKYQLSIFNNLYALLNFSRLMTIDVYGSANINKELIKYHHVHFSDSKHNAKLKMSTFSFVLNSLQAVLNQFIPLTTTVHESASDNTP